MNPACDNKKSANLLKQIIEKLSKNHLGRNEEVHLAVLAYSPMDFIERFTLGIIDIILTKKCALIFTDSRLLHVAISADNSDILAIREINYSKLLKINIKKRNLYIYFNEINNDCYSLIDWPDSTFDSLQDINTKLQGISNSKFNSQYLCPICAEPLVQGIFECNKCKLQFINKKKMLSYSVILPGAYYYCRHKYIPFIVVSLVQIIVLLIFSINLVFEYDKGFAEGIIATIYLIIAIASISLSGYLSAHYSYDFIALPPVSVSLNTKRQ